MSELLSLFTIAWLKTVNTETREDFRKNKQWAEFLFDASNAVRY